MNNIQEARDEVIEKVRAVREAYASRFNYDIGLLFRHASERAVQSGQTVVKRQPKLVDQNAESTTKRSA
jgi:hypothetical protein